MTREHVTDAVSYQSTETCFPSAIILFGLYQNDESQKRKEIIWVNFHGTNLVSLCCEPRGMVRMFHLQSNWQVFQICQAEKRGFNLIRDKGLQGFLISFIQNCLRTPWASNYLLNMSNCSHTVMCLSYHTFCLRSATPSLILYNHRTKCNKTHFMKLSVQNHFITVVVFELTELKDYLETSEKSWSRQYWKEFW